MVLGFFSLQGRLLFGQTFRFEVSKNLGGEWNGIFRLTVTDLKTNQFHSRVFHVNRSKTINLRRRNWTRVEITEWTIFRNVRTTSRGIPKIPKFIPENFCSIRFLTRSWNFRNFWLNGKRPSISANLVPKVLRLFAGQRMVARGAFSCVENWDFITAGFLR